MGIRWVWVPGRAKTGAVPSLMSVLIMPPNVGNFKTCSGVDNFRKKLSLNLIVPTPFSKMKIMPVLC